MKKRKLIRSILVENGYGTANNAKSLTFNGESFPYQIIDPLAFNNNNLLYFYNQDDYVMQASVDTIEPRLKYDKISGYGLFGAGRSFWFDENKGYIVGATGTIIYTEDAGDTFVFRDCPTTTNNVDVYFTNENIGWICGLSGVILKTTDGGLNWVQQSSTTTQHLYNIYFHDSNSGISIGSSGTILKTTNGGETWTGLTTLLRSINNPTGTTTQLSSITFNNMNFCSYSVGYICCNSGYVLKTTDGGNSWFWVKPTTVDMNDLYFHDQYTGFTCGSSKEIWKTTNGGSTWIKKSGFTFVCTNCTFTTISFTGNTGYSFGYDISFKTTDNGDTWDKCDFQLGYVRSMNIFGNKVYTTNNRGHGLGIYDGNTWLAKIDEVYSYRTGTILNQNHLVFAPGDSISSDFFEYKNGEFIKNNIGESVHSSYFLQENNTTYGWIFNNLGYVYKSIDNLNTWNVTSNLNFSYINTGGGTIMYFYNKNFGFISSSSYLHRTTDGGSSWTYIGNSYGSILNFYFINEGTGWVCGIATKLYRTNDSGSTWAQKNTGISTAGIWSIKFLEDGTGFCCGGNGVIAKSTNFGDSWVTLTSNTSIILHSLDMIDENNIWVCGDEGLILYTEDGGATWKTYETNITQSLYSIKFYNKVGYCVGDNRTLIKIG